ATPPSAPVATDGEAPDANAADSGETQTGAAVELEDVADRPGARPPHYFLERIEVTGNRSTSSWVIRHFVPLEKGDVLDVDSPDLEAARWQLFGTGWFDDVQFRLKKGSHRGWVVLEIRVEEHNTLVIQQLAFGVSQGLDSTNDMHSDVQPYFGATVAETNLFGTGKSLQLSGLVSQRQQGAKVRYSDPIFFGTDFLGSATLFINNGREFFGNNPSVSITCPPMLDPADTCPPEVEARSAVVLYQRYGFGFGMGHDLGASTRYTLDWQGEVVDVDAMPNAASEVRGGEVVPVDFAIERGTSYVSSLRLGLIYDRRDDPSLPTSGVLARFQGDLASSLIGSDYRYVKLQVLLRSWHRLPWAHHYLRLGLFAGFVSGQAPFFARFYASDLSDLIPSRILEMNIDNRPPPNLLGTSVGLYRTGDVAGRVDMEYGVPLYRGGSFLRRMDGFLGWGLYGLAPSDVLSTGVRGYEGFSSLPIDMTFDFGLRLDTTIGVFEFGFSSMLGFFVL
ncbi:MAG: BamA/TamA family outer membrane protein, partial [Myxococcales bacterium]|nr:BamA/TamA family outer membrane protein [Myxococcales bacterium]